MRSAALLTGALTLAGLLALALAALVSDRSEAFTLGAGSNLVVKLAPGQEACQRPIRVPGSAGFEGVRVLLGTEGRPGPPLAVSVRDARSGRVLSQATLPGGYPDISKAPEHVVWGRHVAAGGVVSTCFENRGMRRVFV